MDKPWLYGKAVVDGAPRFLSVSRLSGADEREGGCLRKWWYEMVGGRKSPSTRASKRGDDLHAEIERYLKTGNRSLSSLALSGMHMVPEPGPDLLVEHDLALRPLDRHPEEGLDLAKPDQRAVAEARAAELLARAPLTADGIPVLGRMDLIHGRGTNKGGTSIEDAYDPPGTVEVCDWKSTSDPQWIKPAKALPGLIQMAGYGEWVFRVEPAATAVRLSHGYFVERGGPSRKVTLRVLREDVARTWEHAEAVARRIRHAAAEKDPDHVDANLSACDRYGGCYHKEVCKARMHKALADFVGQTEADRLLGRQGDNSMGLLDKMKAQAGSTAPAAPAPGVTMTNTTTETSVGLGISALIGSPPAQQGPTAEQIAAEKAKLEADEKVQREVAILRAAAEKLAPSLKKMEAYAESNPDVGVPAFTGAAAAAYCACKGRTPSGDAAGGAIPGTGKLAGVQVPDVSTAEQIVAQLDALAAAGQIKPPAAPATPNAVAGLTSGLLAPEAPAPTPQNTTGTSIAPAQASGGSMPTASQTITVAATTPPPAEEKKPEPKPEKAPKAPKEPKPKKDAGTAFNMIVDASYEGGEIIPFAPILDALAAELAALAGDLDLRAAGVRAGADGKLVFAKDDSAMSFGRWEGALCALIRERQFTPGTYHLSTRGNRIAEVAASALAEVCRKTGGFFAWGGR